MKFYTKYKINKINNFLDKPYNKFLLWFFIGVLIVFVGIFHVKADSYNISQFSAQLYDNNNGYLSPVSTSVDNTMGIYYGYINLVANSSGGAWGVSSPIPLISGHTYSISVSVPVTGCGTTRLSTYNRIGVGTTLNGAVTSYQGNTYVNEVYSSAINNYILQFVFSPSINGSYIVFPYSTTSSCSNIASHLESIVIDDLGTGGISETTINNSLNNQTNIINNSIQATENSINNSIQSTEESIINNQNENQEKTNELLGDKCNNLFDISDNTTMSNGNLGFSTKDFVIGKTYTIISDIALHELKISNNTSGYNSVQYYQSSGFNKYTFTFAKHPNLSSSVTQYFFFKTQSSPDTWVTSVSTLSNYNIRIVEGSSSSPYCEYGSYISKLDETNNAINSVNDTLNDDDIGDTASDTSDFLLDFDTDTFGLTGIITAPLNLINSLLNSSCSELRLPLPYLDNKFLVLPCMSSVYQQYFGSFFTIYQTITYGIIAYWVCVRIFNHVKDFKNPEHDEIEVLDL